MKIFVPEDIDLIMAMRRSGYGLISNRQGVRSFVRRLASNRYPRFHAYIEDNVINLHLDQKEPSYCGHTAHSGEYDGGVVEEEARRIQEIITTL